MDYNQETAMESAQDYEVTPSPSANVSSEDQARQILQEQVDRAYSFASPLYFEKHLTLDKIREMLMVEGYSQQVVGIVTEALAEQERPSRGANRYKTLGLGLLFFVGGIIATSVSSGRIFIGAIVCGLIMIIRSFFQKN